MLPRCCRFPICWPHPPSHRDRRRPDGRHAVHPAGRTHPGGRLDRPRPPGEPTDRYRAPYDDDPALVGLGLADVGAGRAPVLEPRLPAEGGIGFFAVPPPAQGRWRTPVHAGRCAPDLRIKRPAADSRRPARTVTGGAGAGRRGPRCGTTGRPCGRRRPDPPAATRKGDDNPGPGPPAVARKGDGCRISCLDHGRRSRSTRARDHAKAEETRGRGLRGQGPARGARGLGTSPPAHPRRFGNRDGRR
jgi:hypothetical protein